jgi:hypothetical protein
MARIQAIINYFNNYDLELTVVDKTTAIKSTIIMNSINYHLWKNTQDYEILKIRKL